ncbi:phage terminase small subunit P27 family [Lactiplantibacillus daowaiensis]|uniref:Phage terminase small subunit P27 family n=1 Tax=Lactiplantibacillus daowaiensis TaxID=2559918 RepID=A0ABW1S0Z1_9LACO|nr:phage terminase small subunit P27 family [Lactiplantibacillus daowaiensis]
MGRKIKQLSTLKKHLTNEERDQRKDAETALFDYPSLDLTPPDWLHDRALTEWKRVSPYLKANTPISELDRALLASYCRAYATIQTCESDIRKNGLVQTNQKTGARKPNPYVALQSQATRDLKALANDLGMSLSSRARMELNKQKDETPEDTFEAMLS